MTPPWWKRWCLLPSDALWLNILYWLIIILWFLSGIGAFILHILAIFFH